MLFNNAIILLIILLFIYIITNQLFPYENLDNYSVNHMLFHLSKDNVYLRTNSIDNENNLYSTSEYNMNVLVPPRLNCTSPAWYDRPSYSCMCPDGFTYDEIVGCKPICTSIERYDPINNVCIADCQYGNWSSWSNCHTGNKSRTRTRNTVPPKNGGAACVPRGNIEIDETYCPVDCSYNPWNPWSACKPGSTFRSRTRNTIGPINNGAACIPGANYQVDNTYCPVDCSYSPWNSWSTCAPGSTFRSRTRNTQGPINNGVTCIPGGNYQEDNTYCPIDCSYGSWGNWTSCIPGMSTRERTRPTIQPINNGATCAPKGYLDTDNSYCPVDCLYGGWSDWSTCVAGSNIRTRTRNTMAPVNNGATCVPGGNLDKDDKTCPIDCSYGPVWNPDNCVAGVSSRIYRRSLIQPINGGASCPNSGNEETKTVNDCPIGCQPGTGPFIPDSCQSGVKTRTYRRAYIQATNGGSACPASEETYTKDDCPVDCVLTTDNDFGSCSASCGGGTQYKYYHISSAAVNGGNCAHKDGDVAASQACNTQACPFSGVNPGNNNSNDGTSSIAGYTYDGGGGSGNAVYLNRQNAVCNANTAFNRINLLHNEDEQKYDYDCIGGGGLDSTNASYTLYTPSNQLNDGSENGQYLDRHDVNCGTGRVLSQFKLQRTDDSGNPNDNLARYQYTCLKPNGNLTCRAAQTTTTGNGNWLGDTKSILKGKNRNRQGGGDGYPSLEMQCNANEAIGQFKLISGGGDGKAWAQYNYTCCSISS